MKLASLVSLLTGVGFGLPCALGIRHLVRTGETWTFLGFPTYGGGPFERLGVRTSVPLLAGFLAVCAAEGALGGLLWVRAPSARTVSTALLPVELAFWIGFALPAGPALGICRVALIAASHKEV